MTLKEIATREGTIPFKIPGIEKQCFTWYRLYGELLDGVRPLIALHGGPGAGKLPLLLYSFPL